jgi:hypothetical protein
MLYESAGVRLNTLPVVGLGSVCRRQRTEEIARIVRFLHDAVISTHGFGVKKQGPRPLRPAARLGRLDGVELRRPAPAPAAPAARTATAATARGSPWAGARSCCADSPAW